MSIELEEVKRLRLEPGDTLVLRTHEDTSLADLEALREQMRLAFPDHRTVVLVGDRDLEVVEAGS